MYNSIPDRNPCEPGGGGVPVTGDEVRAAAGLHVS